MSGGRPCMGLRKLLEDTGKLDVARELPYDDFAVLIRNLICRWHMAVPLVSDLIAMQQTAARLEHLVRERVDLERSQFERRRETLDPRTRNIEATYLDGFIAGLQSAASIAERQFIPHNRRIPDLPLPDRRSSACASVAPMSRRGFGNVE